MLETFSLFGFQAPTCSWCSAYLTLLLLHLVCQLLWGLQPGMVSQRSNLGCILSSISLVVSAGLDFKYHFCAYDPQPHSLLKVDTEQSIWILMGRSTEQVQNYSDLTPAPKLLNLLLLLPDFPTSVNNNSIFSVSQVKSSVILHLYCPSASRSLFSSLANTTGLTFEIHQECDY